MRKSPYTLHMNAPSFTSLVRESRNYTVIAYAPDVFYRKTWSRVHGQELVPRN
jgi:hypothetical protein